MLQEEEVEEEVEEEEEAGECRIQGRENKFGEPNSVLFREQVVRTVRP